MKHAKQEENKHIYVAILLKLLILIAILCLIIYSTFSWFADKSNPQITGSQVKVTAADGLVIKLTPDSVGRSEVSLNQLFPNFDEFELKQVSSADSINFYKIDFGQGLSIGNPHFVKIDTTEKNTISNGYIDYDFYLQTEDYAKHVYIHNETKLEGIAADAMRIAVTLEGVGISSNIIFGMQEENGIDNPFTTEAVIKEGEFIYKDIDDSMVDSQIVHLFSYKDGGRSASDDDDINLDKLLCTIPANTQVKVNVKIWLEGGDIDCTNSIASSILDVVLKFGSANVLLNAPELTVDTATHTIIGLTTDMEWATTNNKETIWTKVTDPNMSFEGEKTVYVRIAEIDGISPESYITTVEF